MATSTASADALVLGGGVMGTAAALALARRGARVTLIERFEPGHQHGSSHGDGRIFRFCYPEPVYVELARPAKEGWQRLEEASGEELLVLCGNWEAGPAGCRELAEVEAALRRAGLPFDRLDAGESRRRFPRLALPEASEALFQPDGGLLRADRALACLWREAARAGVRCVTGEAVEALDGGDRGLVLAAAGGRRWTARRLVLAAGAWSRRLAAQVDLDLPLTVTEEQVAYFPAREDGGGDHGPGALPTFIDHHGRYVYGLPQLEVPGVKVGLHHAGPVLDDPDRRRGENAGNLAEVRAFVRERLPGLATEPIRVETCLYTSTPDHRFILDRHPSLPGMAVAAGFSGHGFKFAPVVGDIAAALTLDEEPPPEADFFDLARFAAGETDGGPASPAVSPEGAPTIAR